MRSYEYQLARQCRQSGGVKSRIVATWVARITYTLQSVVQIADIDHLTVQQAALFSPAQLLGALLRHQQPGAKLLRLHLEESSQLLQVHGRVQAQVRLDGRAPHVGLDLVHEDRQVVVLGVDVGLWVVEVWGHGGDEVGAGVLEQLLKDGQRLGSAALQLEQLVTILLAEGRVNGVVQSSGLEGDANGNQSQHLIVLLADVIVLCVLSLEVLGPSAFS